MNIQTLFAIQKKLNDRIMAEHQLVESDLFQEQLLAFLVEIGELANETRCFKYWSRKGASEQKVILEEYVDGVHFLLTIGLALSYTDVKVNDTASANQGMLTERFLTVMKLTHQLEAIKDIDTYNELFEAYIALGMALGFTMAEIEQAYLEKNKVNHQRQDEGY
ncbi:dUTP diphosphatase [Alkalihalobacillus hemicellulosilyticus]|uniref:Dimeric dUTPase n=1 Tax=Halalkalibacter hemicellulosilyticusJCM 9152 TaxID=1236971 RepID=W4QDL6_9BACI|nr:dUTP diphosphatase [Halalkalibacter hemicellulosilyticus]GAE30145.1 dimeric dUTPase [Halalkalibacter hemicellulosilyticusJCM 9152]